MPYASILHSLRGLIAKPMSEQSPGFLGEPAEKIIVCIRDLFPNLLGAIVHLGTASVHGRDALLRVLNSPDVDAGLPVADVAGRFAGGASTDALMKSGTAMLDELFGPKLSLMNEAVSAGAAIRTGSGAALLAMATPFTLGLIKRELRDEGRAIVVPELIGLLDEQKPHLRGHLSPRFFELFGVAETATWLESGRPVVTPAAPAKAADEPEHRKSALMRWLPAIVLLFIALLLLGYCMKRTPDETSDSSHPVSTMAAQASSDAMASSTSAASMASATPAAASDAAASSPAASDAGASDSVASGAGASDAGASNVAASDVAASNAAASDAPASSATAETAPDLVVHFGYGESSVRRGFETEAKALLDYAKAHPDAHFGVSGFTDSSGDAALNEKLANRRAQAVINALQSAGIASSQIEMKRAESVTETGSGHEARRAEVHLMQ